MKRQNALENWKIQCDFFNNRQAFTVAPIHYFFIYVLAQLNGYSDS